MNLKITEPTNHSSAKTFSWKRNLLRIFVLLCFFVVAYLVFFVLILNRFQHKIFVDNTPQASLKKTTNLLQKTQSFIQPEKIQLKGMKRKRINILLLGVGGEGHSGAYLTDTIILASIDPTNYRSAMLSLPRDLYVQLPDSKKHTKINALYTYFSHNQSLPPSQAMEKTKEVITDITHQPIDYYVMLDFSGFKEIVNQLGGIDLEVKKDIYDKRYPGPNYSYETFQIKKGFHHLDAETALKYARVRHTADGDFGRAARQQQVLQAMKKKIFSFKFLANPLKISSFLTTLGEHLKTDISLSEIPAFLSLTKKINIHQTVNQVIDAWSSDALLASSHVKLGRVWAYILLPRAKNYSQIQDLAENIFQQDILKRKKEAIKKELARVLLITSQTQQFSHLKKSFEGLGYKIKLQTDYPSLECQNRDRVISFSTPPKLFTLNDLADKLATTVEYQPFTLKDDTYDVLVCLSDKSVRYFEKQNKDKQNEKYLENSILTKDGDVLVGE